VIAKHKHCFGSLSYRLNDGWIREATVTEVPRIVRWISSDKKIVNVQFSSQIGAAKEEGDPIIFHVK
jgi:hypothetical protein